MTTRAPGGARAPGNAYPRIRRAERSRQLDRDTWAGSTLLVMSYDTAGTGVIESELIDFGVVYEGPPFFSYGVELQAGQTLVSGDYPKVTAGVREWELASTDTENTDARATPFYLGAYLWFSIDADNAYRLRFRLSFEGIAIRNVEYLRGLNG